MIQFQSRDSCRGITAFYFIAKDYTYANPIELAALEKENDEAEDTDETISLIKGVDASSSNDNSVTVKTWNAQEETRNSKWNRLTQSL